jgi:hypothetical protein
MKYVFYGQPNQLVKDRKRKPMSTEFIFKPLFRFDEKGEYITDDPKLIEKLKRKFKFKMLEEVEQQTTFICKKCGESFVNKGFLMAHHRTKH